MRLWNYIKSRMLEHPDQLVCEGEASFEDMLYSPDYGNYDSVRTLKVEGMDRISVSFPLLIK